MASLQEETQARTSLKEVLSDLATMKPSTLARKELGTDLSFESGVVFFSRTLRLFHALEESDLEDISYQKTTQILQAATQTRDVLRSIQNFSVTKYSNNPISQRDNFINQVRDGYDNIFENVAPAVAFTIRKGTDFQKLEEKAKEIVDGVASNAKEHEESLKRTREEAEKIVQEVRKVAQEAGVSQHAIYFKTEADNQDEGAKPWLITTIVLAVLTLFGGVGLTIRYLFVLPTLTPAQSFQIAIPKLFVFSVLLSATIWAGKTYRAYRHNAVVNRHRQNALSTFRAFAEAASDTATKNAVLLQATQCIFSPQQTGYIQGESEITMPHVLEIVRDLGKVGK